MPPSESPTISVVVCTYNRAGLLRTCLESLTQQDYAPSGCEVLVVNNASTDGTREVVLEFAGKRPNITLVDEPRPGASIARNTGIEWARGEYIAFLDDDARAHPTWLRLIVEAFQTIDPAPAAVGGPIVPYYWEPKPEWFDDRLEIRSWGDDPGFMPEPAFSGSNVAIRADLLRKIGGFPEDIGPVGSAMALGEDSAVTHAIFREEARFYYLPDAVVEHYTPPGKMTVRYRLWRAHANGAASIKIEGRPPLAATAKLAGSVTLKSLVLPLRVQWWRRTWRRDFVEHATPVAFRLGRLAATLGKAGRR